MFLIRLKGSINYLIRLKTGESCGKTKRDERMSLLTLCHQEVRESGDRTQPTSLSESEIRNLAAFQSASVDLLMASNQFHNCHSFVFFPEKVTCLCGFGTSFKNLNSALILTLVEYHVLV